MQQNSLDRNWLMQNLDLSIFSTSSLKYRDKVVGTRQSGCPYVQRNIEERPACIQFIVLLALTTHILVCGYTHDLSQKDADPRGSTRSTCNQGTRLPKSFAMISVYTCVRAERHHVCMLAPERACQQSSCNARGRSEIIS